MISMTLVTSCVMTVDDPAEVGAARQSVTGSNGIALNGIALNGIALNGIALNGIALNGIALNGIALNGIALNGIALNGIALNGIALNGAPLDAEQQANLDTLLPYIVSCALPEGQSVTIHAVDGTPRTYSGSMGLAPEWRDGPLSAAGERKVSACLASRSNALAQPVSISLRHPELGVDPVEADIYTTHEGAFWGNLFGADAFVHACLVDGGGLSGRVCAQSDSCGFILMGDCADVCQSYDPVLGYSRCGQGEDTAVINTYLNLGSRMTFGQSQMCALDQGSLSCWGSNRHGQLADGTTVDRSEPVLVSQLGDQVAEAALGSHGCARQRDGSLWCWGRNDLGQVGDGTAIERHGPVHVADDMATFATGDQHTCGVRTDGSLWCWGDNRYGQLGIGSDVSRVAAPAPVPALAAGVARLASSTAARHTCALDSKGAVWCWGANFLGQLGDGSRMGRSEPVQVAVDDSGNAFGEATDLCASTGLTCARKVDGTMWCWGLDQATRPRHMASGVAPGGLACGEMHACFVREDDATAWCFGANDQGQLGHETDRAISMIPGQVPGLDAVSHINAARSHSCATRVDGSLWCWGKAPGHLFSTGLSSTPTRVDVALP